MKERSTSSAKEKTVKPPQVRRQGVVDQLLHQLLIIQRTTDMEEKDEAVQLERILRERRAQLEPVPKAA